MYESYFQLKASPFRLSPDPGFLYLGEVHRQALDFLEYGVHRGEGFIVVTGEIGAGKTVVLRALMHQLSRRKILLGELASSFVGVDDVVPLIAAAFGLNVDVATKGVVMPRLHGFLKGLAAAGRRSILMVDEAQNLSLDALEELRMLSNVQSDRRPLVQSFLVGQPELRDMLQQPRLLQLKQRVIASCHIGPLSQQATGEYVRHRLRRAGWRDDPAIAADALEAVYAATGGVPRQINALCERLMLDAYLARRHVIAAEHVVGVASELALELGGIDTIRQATATSTF
jgi:general secretion pathway protein A